MNKKVVLITGASRGIGKATALLFAERGYDVVVNYKKSEKEAKEVVSLIKKVGSDAIAIQCDVSNEEQVKKMVEEVINKFEKIDVLVNNAGIVFDVPFFERTVKQWKEALETDLTGVFIVSKYVSKHMKKRKISHIINISSTNGINCYHPDSIDYSAAKAGVINLTKSMAKELAPNILVNCIAPGWVKTEMNSNLPKEYVKEEIEKIYLKRFANPEEIAKSILFLASEDASYITGSILTVDGGYQ